MSGVIMLGALAAIATWFVRDAVSETQSHRIVPPWPVAIAFFVLATIVVQRFLAAS
jgi:hypothetical protein